MYKAELFRTYLIEQKLGNTTIDAYMRDASRFCMAIKKAGKNDFRYITKNDVDTYCKCLMSDGMAIVSVHCKLASLKKLFDFLRICGQAEDSPVAGIKLPAAKKTAQRVLTHAEIDKLLLPPGEPTPCRMRDCAMIELMISTGIKVSELIGLRVENAIADCRKLLLVRNSEVVDIYLDEKVHKCLWRYLMVARGVLLNGKDEGTLFLNARGRGMSRQGFWKMLKKRAKGAGIGDVTPETLRRSFAVHFADAGHDIHCLNKVLGHSSIATTKAYVKNRSHKAKSSVEKGTKNL